MMLFSAIRALLITILLTSPVCTQAVAADPSLRAANASAPTRYLDSKLMRRKVPYNIHLPNSYAMGAESGRRYPVLYLLHGLTGSFDNWTARGDVAKFSELHDLIIVTPEGGNGWYTDNMSKDGEMYESYIVKELVPEIDSLYRTLARRDQRAIAGLSMGGYGAIKFGLKYPELFAVVGSFSGALSAASITEKDFPGAIGKTIGQIFGPPNGERRLANDPFAMVRRATSEKIKSFPFIYLDCGTEDFLLPSNRDFVAVLVEKNVSHEYRQLPGGHTWDYWRKQVGEFLRVSVPFEQYTKRQP